MAIRNTRLIIKNSVVPSQTLPSSGVLQGESLVNLGDGILYFSGGTSGSPTWVQSNNPTSGYFEVGSNLYRLKIRDKITSYSGVTDLTGKFLSGTSTGFVLSNISNITGVDTYVTGSSLTTSATTSSNQQTSTLSYNIVPVGGPYTMITENTFTTGGTYDNTNKEITFLRNDGSTGYTVDLSTIDVNDTFVTGGTITYTGRTGTVTLTRNDNVEIPIDNLYDTYITGFSYNDNTFTISDNSGNTFNETINTVTGLTINGDLNVTGNTTSNSVSASTLYVNGVSITGDTFLTGGTYATGGTITFGYNTGGGFPVTGLTQDLDIAISGLAETDEVTIELDLTTNKIRLKDTVAAPSGGTRTFQGNVVVSSGFTASTISATTYYNLPIDPDTYTTGFTYNNNILTISDNSGSTFNATINSVTGLTINGDLTVTGSTNTGSISATTYNTNLNNNLVVYTNGSGQLSTEAGFGYDAGTDKLTVANIDVSNDVVIQGSLTVFGPSVSAFTSNLYVEDNNISLNYNPTGSTTSTSVGAGWTIQDGSGISNTATTLNIGVSYLNGNLSPNTEYTTTTGNGNRNFFTQLGDIIIRNTNYDPNSPNGVRVLAENDILDGGTF
jgi:hypothetical protein